MSANGVDTRLARSGSEELTIVPRQPSESSDAWSAVDSAALDAELHEQTYARLSWTGLAYAATYFLAFSGSFLPAFMRDPADLPRPFDFVVAGLSLLFGLSVFVACRRRLVPARSLRWFGVAYLILGAFGINATAWGWESEITTSVLVDQAIYGIPWVAVWILLFPTILPGAPKQTLVASLTAALSAPLAMGLSVLAHGAPAGVSSESVGSFIFAFSYPALIAAGLAHWMALLYYRMSRDAAKARRMGSYQLAERIGAGGMGEVWKAKHRLLARPAAIKLIDAKAFGPDAAAQQTAIRRFEREAQATAALSSPHTIELYDFGLAEDGTFYYVMELLDGVDLKTLVERYGPLPGGRVVHILRQACHSLHDAHASGMVHRDIKPANIFTCRRGQEFDFVKVLDFGLVAASGEADHTRTQLTRDGMVTGTPAFMAPEMVSGDRAIGPSVDIYALGCVGYWLLTGQLVFVGTSPMAILLQHAKDAPAPPSSRSGQAIDSELEQTIMDCLEKDPAKRPASCRDLSRRLARVTDRIGAWSEERAAEWWRAHRPQFARSETAGGAAR
jgi:serine/threonine-protein kinase